MRIPQPTSLFARLQPATAIHNSGHNSTLTEQTVALSDFGIKAPPLTAMIQVKAVVTSTVGGASSGVFLRHTPGGDDVAQAHSPVIGVPASTTTLLDFNAGRVTFRSDLGAATTYTLVITITGFVRYA